MRLEYLLIELLQIGYFMPGSLKGERILHMHGCLHECIHSFQHYAAYKRTYPQHGEVDDLIDKEATNHDSFERTRNVCEDLFSQRVSTIQAVCRVCQFKHVLWHQ